MSDSVPWPLSLGLSHLLFFSLPLHLSTRPKDLLCGQSTLAGCWLRLKDTRSYRSDPREHPLLLPRQVRQDHQGRVLPGSSEHPGLGNRAVICGGLLATYRSSRYLRCVLPALLWFAEDLPCGPPGPCSGQMRSSTTHCLNGSKMPISRGVKCSWMTSDKRGF